MQVLEDQHQRLSAGDPGEGTGQQLEDLGTVIRPSRSAGLRQRRSAARGGADVADLAQHGEEGDQIRADIGEIRQRGDTGLLQTEELLDDLAEPLIGERAVLLHGAPVKHPDLTRLGEVLELVDEPGLADPRLSGDDRKLALAGDGGIQPLLQLRELLTPSDEGGEGGAPRMHGTGQADDGPGPVAVAERRAISFESLRQFAGALGARGGILGEAGEDDRLQLLVDAGADGAGRLRDLVHDSVED